MAVNEELLKKVLEEIRPNLQADGGDMEYVGVDDEGVVKLELQGACAGCPMSSLTRPKLTARESRVRAHGRLVSGYTAVVT